MTTGKNLDWNWYLIESHSGMMLTAKVEIVANRLFFLLPMAWERLFVEGRWRPVPEPLMPGSYAFVRLPSDPDDEEVLNGQALALKNLRGVRDVYRNARGKWAVVREAHIQALVHGEAVAHFEAGKTRPKLMEQKFPRDTILRIVRHPTAEGLVGKFLFSIRGEATLAMPNGMMVTHPECDLVPVPKSELARLAG